MKPGNLTYSPVYQLNVERLFKVAVSQPKSRILEFMDLMAAFEFMACAISNSLSCLPYSGANSKARLYFRAREYPGGREIVVVSAAIVEIGFQDQITIFPETEGMGQTRSVAFG